MGQLQSIVYFIVYVASFYLVLYAVEESFNITGRYRLTYILSYLRSQCKRFYYWLSGKHVMYCVDCKELTTHSCDSLVDYVCDKCGSNEPMRNLFEKHNL